MTRVDWRIDDRIRRWQRCAVGSNLPNALLVGSPIVSLAFTASIVIFEADQFHGRFL
jgi:hypothetical protein